MYIYYKYSTRGFISSKVLWDLCQYASGALEKLSGKSKVPGKYINFLWQMVLKCPDLPKNFWFFQASLQWFDAWAVQAEFCLWWAGGMLREHSAGAGDSERSHRMFFPVNPRLGSDGMDLVGIVAFWKPMLRNTTEDAWLYRVSCRWIMFSYFKRIIMKRLKLLKGSLMST